MKGKMMIIKINMEYGFGIPIRLGILLNLRIINIFQHPEMFKTCIYIRKIYKLVYCTSRSSRHINKD